MTKYNSIQGNKNKFADIVYTPAYNLLKKKTHSPGEVTFKDLSLVRKVLHLERNTKILNPVKRTKVESFPDLITLRKEYDLLNKKDK